jgi:hypothetical protein
MSTKQQRRRAALLLVARDIHSHLENWPHVSAEVTAIIDELTRRSGLEDAWYAAGNPDIYHAILAIAGVEVDKDDLPDWVSPWTLAAAPPATPGEE